MKYAGVRASLGVQPCAPVCLFEGSRFSLANVLCPENDLEIANPGSGFAPSIHRKFHVACAAGQFAMGRSQLRETEGVTSHVCMAASTLVGLRHLASGDEQTLLSMTYTHVSLGVA